MTTDHQMTPEAIAYERLIDDVQERLSWPAEALFYLAHNLAYAEYMVRSYSNNPENYYEVHDKMSFVAIGLTDRDQELLKELVRAARTAANSLDSEDYETVVRCRAHPAELHHWHKMTAEMVESTLREENARRRAMEDPSYIPF